MNLLTVTCDRDYEEIITQAQSIETFLNPCCHYIFVNNTKFKRKFWIKSLKQIYKKHKLKIYFTDDYYDFSKEQGWITQQIWKCLAIDWIKDDYIILDSKNFFIKPVNLNDWQFNGSGYVSPAEGDQIDLISYYSKIYNLETIIDHYSIITPFIFRKDIAYELSNLLKQELVFLKDIKPLHHSEFILYSLLFKKNNLPFEHLVNDNYQEVFGFYINNSKSCVLKTGKKSIVKNMIQVLNYYNMEVSGIHFSWYREATSNERKDLCDWLDTLGILNTKIKNKILYHK